MFPAGELGFDFKEERQMISSLNKKELSLSRGRARGHWRVAVALVTAMTVVFLSSCGGGRVLKIPTLDGSSPMAQVGTASPNSEKTASIPGGVWERTFGGDADDFGYAVAVDSSGNAYVAGKTFSFGQGYEDMIIMKYAPDGSISWKKSWGTSGGSEWAEAAVVDGDYLYVAGSVTTGSGMNAHQDAALVKLATSDGSLSWDRYYGTTGSEIAYGVDVDSNGNVFIGVTHADSQGDVDVIIVKYDSSGNLASSWDKIFGDSNCTDQVYGIDVEGSYLYVTGYTTSVGSGDAFAMKVSTSTPSVTWQKYMGTSEGSEDRGYDVAVDSSGNVYVTGRYDAVYPGSLTYKLNSSGTFQWRHLIGTAIGLGIDTDGTSVFITGIADPVGTPFNPPEMDVLFVKYSVSDGSVGWALEWDDDYDGDDDAEAGYGIALDGSDYAYIAGYAPNNTGSWGNIQTGASLARSDGNTSFTLSDLSATSGDPDATLSSITTGTEDDGGGGSDVLVLKYDLI